MPKSLLYCAINLLSVYMEKSNNFRKSGGRDNRERDGGRGGRFGGKDRGSFRGREGGRGGRDDRPTTMYPAVCANCKINTEVPFRPTGDKPVYCRDCFNLQNYRGDSRGDRDNRSDSRGKSRESRGDSRDNIGSSRNEDSQKLQKQIDEINVKLDKILDVLTNKQSPIKNIEEKKVITKKPKAVKKEAKKEKAKK